jgi:hypothetical protein
MRTVTMDSKRLGYSDSNGSDGPNKGGMVMGPFTYLEKYVQFEFMLYFRSILSYQIDDKSLECHHAMST